MKQKTPAKIAARIVKRKNLDGYIVQESLRLDSDTLVSLMTEAIEADRAQREAAQQYWVMCRGTGKNADMSECIIGRFESRYNADAVAAAWNKGNGRRGFEYYVEDQGE